MKKIVGKIKRQSAVIPTRFNLDGNIEVLLITNKDRTRWGIPKGNFEPGMTPLESAAKEAWEEGGAKGRTLLPVVGEYVYEKNGIGHLVEVYVMVETKLSGKWPEMMRRRRWCSIGDAMELVHSRGLSEVLGLVRDRLMKEGAEEHRERARRIYDSFLRPLGLVA